MWVKILDFLRSLDFLFWLSKSGGKDFFFFFVCVVFYFFIV